MEKQEENEMSVKKIFKAVTLIITVTLIIFVISSLNSNFQAMAQTWQALPPYNFLWPLWSPILSPIDPVTGLKTPVVSDLYYDTVLPVQPGVVWNYIFDYPYFLYNSPVGLQYYDVVYGINPWPPSYSLDAKGFPIPIILPVGYQYLPPSDIYWLQENLPLANSAYIAQYPTWALAAYNAGLPPKLVGLDPWLASLVYPTPSISSLLTIADLLGYTPPVLAPAPALVATPTVAVAPPTVAAAPVTVVPAPVPIPTPVAVAAPAPLPVAPAPVTAPIIPPTNIIFALTLLGFV